MDNTWINMDNITLAIKCTIIIPLCKLSHWVSFIFTQQKAMGLVLPVFTSSHDYYNYKL